MKKELDKDDLEWFDDDVSEIKTNTYRRNPFSPCNNEDEEKAWLEYQKRKRYKKFSNEELEENFFKAFVELHYLNESDEGENCLLEDIKQLLIKYFPNYKDSIYDTRPKQVIEYIDHCMFSIGEDTYMNYIIDKEMDEYEKQHAEEYPEKYFYDEDSGEYIEY